MSDVNVDQMESLNLSCNDGVAEGEENTSSNTIDAVEEGKAAIALFLKQYTCYDLISKSGKVVVFDTNIAARLAYYALVEHSIGAAPLWDPVSQKFVGMITVSDFIEVLRHGYQTQSISEIIDKHSISSWRSLLTQLRESPTIIDSLIEQKIPGVRAAASAARERDEVAGKAHPATMRPSPAHLVPISPDDSLYHACCLLRTYKIHRLPIIDPKGQACLAVITHLVLLRFLVNQFREDRPLFNQAIGDLGIGTFQSETTKIISATRDTKLIDILRLLAEHGISCVPIVDENGQPVDIFTRSNVTQLATHEQVETVLERSVWEIIRSEGSDKSCVMLFTCTLEDSLHTVFLKFKEAEVHRLLCVDAEGALIGIVSLSDLLSYFVDDIKENGTEATVADVINSGDEDQFKVD